ncbi:MAG: type II secretion system protein [bacterium]
MAARRRQGFTLIELLVVITIIGILAAIALPNYIKAKDKAKETQARSSLHSLQVAVERYHTDFEKYPPFLLGGDIEGWKNWHNRYDDAVSNRLATQNNFVQDPLIQWSYLQAYPLNPFVDNGLAVIAQTGAPTGPGGTIQSGDGDPRFGFRGDTMGNMLDDPAWSKHRITGYPAVETSWIELPRTLQNAASLGFVTYPNGTVYMGGGRVLRDNPGGSEAGGGAAILDPEGQLQFAYTFWPGNYFYRGLFDIPVLRKGFTHYDPGGNPGTETNRYIMGTYGAFGTRGQDVIRLETRDFDGGRLWYHQPPPWNPTSPTDYSDIFCGYGDGTQGGEGLPEVAGGGDAYDGPWYPYDFPKGDYGDYIYGAPDGVPDGVILILHAGADGVRSNTY